jgi:hypothetical protein
MFDFLERPVISTICHLALLGAMTFSFATVASARFAVETMGEPVALRLTPDRAAIAGQVSRLTPNTHEHKTPTQSASFPDLNQRLRSSNHPTRLLWCRPV